MQTLLEMLLFEKDLMLQELRRHPEFILKISEFTNKTYLGYREQGCIDVCGFPVRLSMYLQNHWEYVTQKDPALSHLASPPFLNPRQEVEILLHTGSLSNLEKSLLYTVFISACSPQEVLSEKDLKQVLIGISHLDRHPLPLLWRDPAVMRDIRTLLQKNTQRIRDLPSHKMQELLNALARDFQPGKQSEASVEETFPIFKHRRRRMQDRPAFGACVYCRISLQRVAQCDKRKQGVRQGV